MASRLAPDNRREQLLSAALVVAERVGYFRVERAAVAEEAGVSPTLISHYFGTMPELRATVMREAATRNNRTILRQGEVMSDPVALDALNKN